MFSTAMHTEFSMFFTTLIGQPLDASVHVLLGEKKILVYYHVLLGEKKILVYYMCVFYLLQT